MADLQNSFEVGFVIFLVTYCSSSLSINWILKPSGDEVASSI